jgi:hypothetical protein
MLTLKEKPRDIEKEYQDILEKIKKGDTSTIEIDETLFTRIRIGIIDGEISNTNVQLIHEDTTHLFTNEGFLLNPPKKCFSNNLHLTGRLLRSSQKKYLSK